MTTGERIAQCRKQAGLSQEKLGEILGVSRQAISKWESNTALPEVDKLLALSRSFSVSVGWLLGAEEQPRNQSDTNELSEAQLQLVDEIVARYLAAQPKPKPLPRWQQRLQRLSLPLTATILTVALVVSGCVLMQHINDNSAAIQANYDYTVGEVGALGQQINSITDQIQQTLDDQDSICANWALSVSSIDAAADTATVSFTVVPKQEITDSNHTTLQCYAIGANGVTYPAKGSWDGSKYIALVVLPAADGYSYYFTAPSTDGTTATKCLADSDSHYNECSNLLDKVHLTVVVDGDSSDATAHTKSVNLYGILPDIDETDLNDGFTATLTLLKNGTVFDSCVMAYGQAAADYSNFDACFYSVLGLSLSSADYAVGDKLTFCVTVTATDGRTGRAYWDSGYEVLDGQTWHTIMVDADTGAVETL